MKKAILFRYHTNFDVCRNHIELFKHYNPGVAIYGMYGGTKENWQMAKTLPLTHNWNVPIESSYFKWKNGDLCQRLWYKDVGHTFDFDVIYGFGWDSLLLAPLSSIYPEISNTVFLKNVHPLDADNTRFSFVIGEYRKQWLNLLELVKTRYAYDQIPIGCLFLGAGIPRSFWDRYSNEDIPEYCNDETRVAIFAQSWNYPIYDTGKICTNCTVGRKSLSKSQIVEGFKKGEILFNPVHINISLKDLFVYPKANQRRL